MFYSHKHSRESCGCLPYIIFSRTVYIMYVIYGKPVGYKSLVSFPDADMESKPPCLSAS